MPRAAATALALVLFGHYASAQQVEIQGHITTAAPGFALGEPYVLQFEWVGPGPAYGPFQWSPTTAWYLEAGRSLHFTTAAYEIGGPAVAYAASADLAAPYSRLVITSRTYFFANSAPTPLTYSGLLDGRQPYAVHVELTDSTGTAFGTPQLSEPLVDLQNFDSRFLEISFASQVFNYGALDVVKVYGTVETMKLLSPIPEPTSARMMILGGAILAGWMFSIRRRRK